MAHIHDHHDPVEMQNHLIKQILTIAICGAMGAVSVSLYVQGTLRLILHPSFHRWVLMGGVTLLVMVLIRGIALWQFAGKLRQSHDHAHDHDHDHHHTHDHDHDHDHHHEHVHAKEANPAITAATGSPLGLNVISAPVPAPAAHVHDENCCDHDHDHSHDPSHAHDHDHDHGWAPWRYVLLLLPVALFFLNLPSEIFSSDSQPALDMNQFDLNAPPPANGNDQPLQVGFLGLELAALSPDTRAFYAGRTVSLTGRYSGLEDNRFTLVRYKINCCAADAIPLNAIIMINPAQVSDPKLGHINPTKYRNAWVSVTGQVQFLNRKGTSEYLTALIVTPTPDKPLDGDLVKKVDADPNPYAD